MYIHHYVYLFIAALCTIASIWKQPMCPSINEWLKKTIYIYIYIYIYTHTHTHIHTHTHTCTHTMEYYSAIKENGIFPFATMWIDLEGIMLSEISQTEKNKYCMISLICGI